MALLAAAEAKKNTVSESNFELADSHNVVGMKTLFIYFPTEYIYFVRLFKNSESFEDDDASMSTSRSTPMIAKASGSGIARRNRKLISPAQSESVSSIATTPLQRALQTLEQPSDELETFGNFVAGEMRQLSNLDGAIAGRLKRQIVTKLVMNAFDDYEDATSSAVVQLPQSTPTVQLQPNNLVQWQIIEDPSLSKGTMQLFDPAGEQIENLLSFPLVDPVSNNENKKAEPTKRTTRATRSNQ